MSSSMGIKRWLGLLGSWALFVLGLGLASIAVAGEWVNISDSQKLRRYVVIEKLIGDRLMSRSEDLLQARKNSPSSLNLLRSRMTTASRTIDQNQDAYYVELARKKGLSVVRLKPGQAIDADTGRAAQQTAGGVWNLIGESAGSHRVLAVENNTVVEITGGVKRELPAGALIHAGETIVIPPVGTPQRRYTKLAEKGESIFGGH